MGLIDDNFNKMYKNRLTVVIRNAKKLYYRNASDCYKKNIKKTWQTVKHLIGSDVGRERVRSLFVDGPLQYVKRNALFFSVRSNSGGSREIINI